MEEKLLVETASMLIRFYNMQTGQGCHTNNPNNQAIVIAALKRANNDVALVRDEIKNYTGTVPHPVLSECFANICRDIPEEKQEVIETKPQESKPESGEVGYAIGILEKAVVKMISEAQAERIESEIMNSVEDKVREFIKSEYGTIERKVVTVINGERKPMNGVCHEKFDTILKFVANDEPLFLTGPAGSGKNVLCKQVADALGLNFYFTNAVTQEYKLTGFTDAMGTYQPTQFYKAFTEGGLFMLDEMDASIPEVLVILNAAIANRYFDFPAPIGYTEAHPDFRVVAAGNTTGHGASIEYVGRNQLDAASLDRFAVVEIAYSKTIEDSVTCGDAELADFCRDFRAAAQKTGVNVICSYRAMGRLAKMLKLLDVKEAIRTCLVKGLEKDDVNMICSNMSVSNQYSKALKNCM